MTDYKNKMKRFVILLLLISLMIVSCQKIFFSEEESTREINLEKFHAVNFRGIYNIVLIQDSTDRLVITGKNNINSIDAFIKNDTLTIDDHKKMSFNPEKNSLTLHFTNLEYFASYNPVNITNRDTLKADHFMFVAIGEIAEVRFRLNCNFLQVLDNSNTLGYLHFIGKAESCWIWNRYGTCMYTDSLQCKDAVIYNESVGDVSVNASDNIHAFIRSPGNILYRGNPVITLEEKKGEGRLIHLD
jgi:hypothetical protein